ncbi:MAG: hypothetical protein EOP10_03740 [Proteobacteria bacterium]|nr:MAG: hypothetical protein EOP10_03740 [Pseudomonadota bacterium]
MKTIFAESTIDAVNYLCAPWTRVAQNIWIEKNTEIDLDLSEDNNFNTSERIIAEAAISLFDADSSVRLQAVCSLDEKDYERFQNALKIVRRTSDLSEIVEGDCVRTITYKKILALAERKGLNPQPFEDIAFPKYPFLKELIPYCGEELRVLAIHEGAYDLEVGGDEWTFPKEWISGKARN